MTAGILLADFLVTSTHISAIKSAQAQSKSLPPAFAHASEVDEIKEDLKRMNTTLVSIQIVQAEQTAKFTILYATLGTIFAALFVQIAQRYFGERRK